MSLKMKSMFLGKIFIFSFFSFHCKNGTSLMEKNHQYSIDNKIIMDSVTKWGKINLFNNIKFYLYCYHSLDYAVDRQNKKVFKKKDTIPFYTMDLYAYQAKYCKDTFDVNFEFYNDTTSFYLYGLPNLKSKMNGLVFYKDSLLKLKYGNDTNQTVSGPDYFKSKFYQDTLKAYELFRTNKNSLNSWLYNECKKRNIF